MKYQEFLMHVEEAKNCETAVEARLEYGFPPDCEWTGDGLAEAFDIIFAVSRENVAELVKISKLKQSVFARKFNIPLRSMQRWTAATRVAPVYVIQLIGYVMLIDCEKAKEQEV